MNELEARLQLKDDFIFYAKNCLKIRTKEGSVKPLELNSAQIYIHHKLEEQKKLKGKVRAIIVKGRQQGCSTYIAARFYHQTTHRQGCKAFILAHREDATNNLYGLVNRYHDNCPAMVKPSVGVSNAKSLYFDQLDSGYALGTSGGGSVGRSDTIQLLHGSEVGFWENTDEISSGIMQTVPDMVGTEIILESTANGIGNMFHKLAMIALAGETQYQVIFVPWFWQNEYRMDLPEDFSLTNEETEYKTNYDLDDKQIFWRRNKVAELAGGAWQFKQEYPATLNEAFQSSSDNSFIQPETVMKARKAENVHADQQLIIGVDPAHKGKDKTAVVWRKGRIQYKSEQHSGLDTMAVVGRLVQIINHDKPQKVFIDVGGIGAGIYDRLKELGYGSIVVAVNFGEKADDPARYANKRAEMLARVKEWLERQPCKIEDSDQLHGDLTAAEFKFDSSGRLLIEPKDKIKERIGRSPDLSDALCLTFAFIIPDKAMQARYNQNMQIKQADWSIYD